MPTIQASVLLMAGKIIIVLAKHVKLELTQYYFYTLVRGPLC